MTIYEADWICPISRPPVRNGRFAVQHGKIVDVPEGAGEPIVRFPGCAIIPGFVNAHTHIELTILRGYLDDLPFGEWIPRLTQAKYQLLSRADLLVSARLGAIEMLRAGVTCLGEVMDVGTSWEAMREFGLQGIAYQEVFGPAPEQADEAMKGLEEKVAARRGEETSTFRIGVSPHAPYTVSSKLYPLVREFAERENLRMTAHIAESPEESLFVRSGSGVFAERLRQRGIDVQANGCSPIAYVDSFGLLGPQTLLIHAIDLDDSDFELLRSKLPAIVHCPKSNAKLGHRIARLSDLRDAGIVLGLGTDSVSSNNVVDMFEEMRAAIFAQRMRTQKVDGVNAEAAFRMATLGGAECLGMQNELGSLDVGKRADFVVVDLNDPAVQPVYDPIQTMVYSASRHNVRATYVAGEEANLDSADVLEEFITVSRRLKG